MDKYEPYRGTTLNWVGKDSWCIYADGFKRAAELLIANVATTYEINTVIFPILFLCRHYLELTLKEVIGYGRYVNQAEASTPGSHDLKELWKEAKSYIRKEMREISTDELKRIEALILEFHGIDPTSERSRYPIIKKRRQGERQASFSADSTYTHINLDALAQKVKTIGEFLEMVTSYLSAAQDLEAEFRADYYRNSF